MADGLSRPLIKITKHLFPSLFTCMGSQQSVVRQGRESSQLNQKGARWKDLKATLLAGMLDFFYLPLHPILWPRSWAMCSTTTRSSAPWLPWCSGYRKHPPAGDGRQEKDFKFYVPQLPPLRSLQVVESFHSTLALSSGLLHIATPPLPMFQELLQALTLSQPTPLALKLLLVSVSLHPAHSSSNCLKWMCISFFPGPRLNIIIP